MPNALFTRTPWQTIQSRQQTLLDREVAAVTDATLLASQPAQLAIFFENKFRLDAPELLRGQEDIETHHEGATLHVNIRVPFAGDPDAFQIRPSEYSFDPPRLTVEETTLLIHYEFSELKPAELKIRLEAELDRVEANLVRLRKDIDAWNASVRPHAQRLLETRIEQLRNTQAALAELGLPVRGAQNTTYPAPELQRAAQLSSAQPPQSLSSATHPEPVMTEGEYEHILDVLQYMALVIERTPATFANIGEEDLRNHFLVQLNGHYKGQATGETFNGAGKTDLLVRSGEKNVFVAECKFWGGEKEFSDALDQLLTYSTWRDAKLALLMFYRGERFTEMLQNARFDLRKHPQFRETLKPRSETQFRYRLAHPQDNQRQVLLTVLCFKV